MFTTDKNAVRAALAATLGVATLAYSTVAQALPTVPLAPTCGQFTFENGTKIDQSNGFLVDISSVAPRGQHFTASAVAYVNSKAHEGGTVSGDVDGTSVSFTINWSGGSRGRYTGTANADGGGLHGTTFDVDKPSSSATWSANFRLRCVSTPSVAEPAPGPVQTPAPKLATVISDVDLYDSRGFDGNVIGILREGERYQLGSCVDGSCEVKGKGFAAEEFFRRG